MCFKSSAMKSSTRISNAFESLASSLVTMYRSTSFSQNNNFFQIIAAYFLKITTLHLSLLAIFIS